jgi:N-acetyl-gamma-glutamyl-phosphate reductase
MIRVAILGGSGYTALELMKLLLRHPQAHIVAVTTRQEGQEGTPLVSELHPSLARRLELRCQPFDPDRLAADRVECVFSCLPHGVSMSCVGPLLERGLRVIDLSADYRLHDPNVYAQWYGESHRDLSHLTQAVYGLPEIYAEEVKSAQLVANPGCYPQAAILGLAPLVAGQAVELRDLVIDAKSGVSGAGRTPKLTTHFPECNESVAAYAVGQHRHTPEIEQVLSDIAGRPVEVLFTPHLIPMDRGIFATIYARPSRQMSEDQLLELYRQYYAAAPFVRVVQRIPATKDTFGTNFVDVTVRVVRGRILVLVCEDNLVRGASGVAVQNFNLMYGLPETLALL